MRLQLKILGVVYALLGALSAALALILLTHAFASGWRAGAAPFILMGLTLWFLQTGVGLWRLRRGALTLAALTAALLLVILNAALLFAGAGGFAPSAAQTVFRVALVAVGLYTLAVVLHPRAKAEIV